MNVIDHMGLTVSDYARALRFYEEALAPLDISLVMQVKAEESGVYEGAAFGGDGKPSFWLQGGGRTAPRIHVAFVAHRREAVDAVHQAALAAGGKDNGAP